MRIPYIIDNQTHKLADVLNALLREHAQHSLDIATAYFSLSGFRLLREQLSNLSSFRLLLGFQPTAAKAIGMRPRARARLDALRGDLDAEPFTEEILRLVGDLIAFLRRPNVAVRLYENGFLHASRALGIPGRRGQKGTQDSGEIRRRADR